MKTVIQAAASVPAGPAIGCAASARAARPPRNARTAPRPRRAAVLAPDDDSDGEGADTGAPGGGSGGAAEVPPLTTRQLVWVAFTKGIPFVAFGFMDNFIMVWGPARCIVHSAHHSVYCKTCFSQQGANVRVGVVGGVSQGRLD
jgi:hypothetical protein